LKGIIHGDIKPANVLVFDNAEQSAIEIKIADFGFSCFGAADEDDVQLSKTEPWEAPEWDHRYWSVSEAKQMDVYSFGLLCLWLLFTSTTLGDYNLSGVTLSDAFLGQNHLALAWLQSVKMCGGLLQLAEHLVEKKADIDDTTRAHLRRVFALSLVSDPQKRSTDMGIFVRLLCEVPGAL
jgi:serine/threonine protein kinase